MKDDLIVGSSNATWCPVGGRNQPSATLARVHVANIEPNIVTILLLPVLRAGYMQPQLSANSARHCALMLAQDLLLRNCGTRDWCRVASKGGF
ncbi:hypothetical protein VFPPC_17615 [Pochonia chlamydosporia 170]|uniref:Uncharacterized protein n=1 Tax=Pochonia chlamydosporia 170 TaxID=1380566 RepID=A0A219ARI9_METCM|nr:hypothetical protein VFPPC_17615 [Pochonia chlamydosporia 170]OWT43222.1 hypothetical protein VFPPC_17615 [Pochonia chlamydosporia 170]